MNVAHTSWCGARNNGATFDDLTLFFPPVPESSKCETVLLLRRDKVRHFLSALFSPFVITRRGHDTSATYKWLSIGATARQAFRPGIEHTVFRRGLVRPVRHQPQRISLTSHSPSEDFSITGTCCVGAMLYWVSNSIGTCPATICIIICVSGSEIILKRPHTAHLLVNSSI